MIDRFEILWSRVRHLVSHSRWSARLTGFPERDPRPGEPGLVLIQIDGLAEPILRRELERGGMPFLRHLLEDEGHHLQSVYSGFPSNTPGFQAEFFFGVRTAVPAFGYRDRAMGRIVSMGDPSAAAALEKRLRRHAPGLLTGGSAWSDLFGGDAAEPHFCASTAGLDMLLRALNPLRVVGLLVWHGTSVLRVLYHLVRETAFAFGEFVRGTLAGRDLLRELRFVPERILITAGLREVVTAGASADAARGVPIIHVNLLGYDEHAHHRGPDSRFAAWTLRGIDKCVRRIWMAAHRSRTRDYQVWIHSDHGQETTRPYPQPEGDHLGATAARIHAELRDARPGPRGRGVTPHPIRGDLHPHRWARSDLPPWVPRPGDVPPTLGADPPGRERPSEIEVTHQGPVGFVYLPDAWNEEGLDAFARALCSRAQVPTVLRSAPDGGALVHRADEPPLRLPEQAARVFGEGHPYLAEVTRDVLAAMEHPDAGDLMLLGYHPDAPGSLQHELGAHGGPGPIECSAFAILPPETDASDLPSVVRPADLRDLALRVRSGRVRQRGVARGNGDGPRELRVMSYNVHGCRGMDGRISAQRIARVIARADAHVICLQELDHERTRSDGVDQVAAIARSLENDYHFHPVAEVDDGRFGNAILSDLPLRLVRSGGLPHLSTLPALEERGVLWVEVDLDGLPVQILNTHLSILPQERRVQVDALLSDRWLGHPECEGPVVLCGDLNAGPESYVVRRLKERLPADHADPADGSVPHTWSGRLPLRRIDHVFTSPDLHIRRVDVPRDRLTRVASDHLPLVVDLMEARAPVTPEPT